MTATRLHEILAAAKAAISGGYKSSEYTITLGSGAKSYSNTVVTNTSPEVQAAMVIEAGISEVCEVYFRGGEQDNEAIDALEAFARENKIGYLCGVKG